MNKFLKVFWKMFRSNLALKIAAVLFAIILWSYVLSVVNPLRVREISNVQITYNTESLLAKDLAISADLSDIPLTVNVRVKVNQNDVKNLSNQNVQANIDLSGINSPGTYPRTINASTTYGQVLEVSPKQVTLYVDKNVTRQVPVIYNPEGSVPAGYYADAPDIIPDIINIPGAESDVKKVVSARCTVNLDGLTKGFSRSFEVELLDADGNVVDPGLFPGTLPSVIVNLSVLSVKTVDVDLGGSIVGQDSIAAGYEITNTDCNPKRVRIVGEKALLDGINSIKLIPFSVAGSNTDIITLYDFAPPEGVRVLDFDKAEVTVNIREKTDQKTYKNVAIKTRNLSPGLAATIDPSSIDVTVLAGISKLSKLLRSDIIPCVDLDGLKEGTCSAKVYFILPDGFAAENFTPSVTTVNVTIKKR